MSRGAVAIQLALAVGVLAVSLGPIGDGDIYWHLAAGREIVRTHAVPRVDVFTVSAAGRPWTDVHWLFQVIVFLLHGAGGMLALAVAKSAVLVAGATVLVRTAERSAGPLARDLAAVALLGLLFLARHLIPLRPSLVSLLLIAVFFATLEAHRAGRRRSLMLLPCLQVLWANCQGLSPLGPALIAAYLCGALVAARGSTDDVPRVIAPTPPVRALLVALVLSVGASFATPYGLAGAALPARLLSRILPGGGDALFSREIAENVPPFILERTAPELIGHFKWVLLVLGAALALVRPRIPVAHGLVLGGFGALALIANRNVPLFYWVAAPVAAMALAPALQARLLRIRPPAWLRRTTFARAGTALLALVVGGELACAGVAFAREAPAGTPTPFHFPVESARHLAESGASGPIFAPDQHGGFLEWSVPALRPYLDTRLVLHSADEYQDYLAVLDDPDRFAALEAEADFRYVLLCTTNPDRYLALLAHLAADPRWRLVWTDGYEVLFNREGPAMERTEPRTVEEIEAGLRARYRNQPQLLATARLHLARTLIVLGQPAAAERVLATTDAGAAAALRARARFAGGDLPGAEALARVLAAQNPADQSALTLLAEITLATGRRSEAMRLLATALESAPYDPGARAILTRLQAGSGRASGPR